MEQPSGKAEIINRVRASHAELVSALQRFTLDKMTLPGVNGEWTIKDMLAHVTWWEKHLLRRLRSGHDDVYDGVTDVAEGRRRTDEANARILAEHRDQPLPAALDDFDASYAATLAYIEAMPADDLAREDIAEPVGFDTYGHYPEHTQMLEKWRQTLDAQGAGGQY
jgi:hypothetical protein